MAGEPKVSPAIPKPSTVMADRVLCMIEAALAGIPGDRRCPRCKRYPGHRDHDGCPGR
jgi:hypothetical protein